MENINQIVVQLTENVCPIVRALAQYGSDIYQPNQYDLFLGSKDHRKRYGYYLQKISYARFLHFLCEFQYAPSLIEACTELYDDSCLFDVGFDFWNDGSLAKTMLYGIFTTHKAS